VSQTPPSEPFIPPPPPGGNSLYPSNVLAAKAAEVASDVKTGLILAIFGIFCFGFIFGFLAFRRANNALETINIYQVAEDKRGMATTVKLIAILDIVLWGIGLLLRVFVLR
jgi:hypothetical protein